MKWFHITNLKTRVNGEATSCRVHTGNILGVVDILEGQLVPVVPMAMVNVLSHERVRLHSEVLVDLWIIKVYFSTFQLPR